MLIKKLIWDEWNVEHMDRHQVTLKEVEEICFGEHKVIKSYRKRVLLLGKTHAKRSLAVVLSPEDRQLHPYTKGVFYVITAFDKEVKNDKN